MTQKISIMIHYDMTHYDPKNFHYDPLMTKQFLLWSTMTHYDPLWPKTIPTMIHYVPNNFYYVRQPDCSTVAILFIIPQS